LGVVVAHWLRAPAAESVVLGSSHTGSRVSGPGFKSQQVLSNYHSRACCGSFYLNLLLLLLLLFTS